MSPPPPGGGPICENDDDELITKSEGQVPQAPLDKVMNPRLFQSRVRSEA